MDFVTKRLYASVLVLAATPVEARAAETASATKTLATLRARAGMAAKLKYGEAVSNLVTAIGPEGVAALGGDSEPWIAFTSRGPGYPPPAVELAEPAPDAGEDENVVWYAFKRWTSPGQMIGYLVDGELPDNELKQLAETVTVTVASTAVAGISAIKGGIEAVANFSIGKLAIGLAVGVGGYLYFRRKKGS